MGRIVVVPCVAEGRLSGGIFVGRGGKLQKRQKE